MEPDFDALVTEWEQAQEAMNIAVEAEVAARAKLVAAAFPNPKFGTNSRALPDGMRLVAKYPRYYKVDVAKLESDAIKNLPTAIRDAVIKWKPDVSHSGYNALEPAHRMLFNEVITISAGRPQVEIDRPSKR